MFKAVKNLQEQKGFTLIELLIVVAIIGILAAVGIPGYLGMQERSKKGSMQGGVDSVGSELLNWLQAAKNANATESWVDQDFDGIIEASETNDKLTAGVAESYVTNRLAAKNEKSPFDGTIALWSKGDTVGASEAGVIALGQALPTGPISIIAADLDGTVILKKMVSAD